MPEISDLIQFERQLLEEAAVSPVAALMRLSIEVERELRRLLAPIGLLQKAENMLPEAAIDLLSGYGHVDSRIKSAVAEFWNLRNQLVHGQGTDRLILRALDYGFRLLRMIRSIPRPSFVVIEANVQVFADADCIYLRPDVTGVVLQAFSPEGKPSDPHIYPSTRTYRVLSSVSWEWSNQRRWDETWYRTKDAAPQLAWSSSLEFVGRDIEEI